MNKRMVSIILTIMLLIGNLFLIPLEAHAAVTSISIPISVKAASSSYNSIKTGWGAVSGASGYEVHRATSSTGTYTLLKTTTATSYDNTGLTTNRTYYYKVRAYSTMGTTKVYSNFSATVSAKPIPSVPVSVKAASSSYNSINTSWGAVTGASGYEVHRATPSTGTYSLLKTTTATSYNNAGLTTNKTYYYKVKAYRIVGTTKVYSNFSAAVSAKSIPSAPVSVKAISSSHDSIKTTWGAVIGASGYEVHRATSSIGTYTLMKTTTATSYNNTGLTTNKTYYYKVRAYRTVGTTKVYSNFSSVVKTVPTPLTPNYAVDSFPAKDNIDTIVLLVSNFGTKPLTITSNDAALYYDDASTNNRVLQLIDINGNSISSTNIPAGGSAYVCFGVLGDPTWYDEYAYVYYELTYDSVSYYGRTSHYYGSQFLKK